MIRMRVKNISVGFGPIPSAVTLQAISQNEEALESPSEPEVIMQTTTQSTQDENTQKESSALNMLPIRMSMADTAAIAAAVESRRARPLTHELLSNTIEMLGGKLVSVSITRAENTTFYATLDIESSGTTLLHVDARPSDAIALALQNKVDILASEELLEQAGSLDFEAIAAEEHERQAEEFHDFVETLNPEDFSVHKDN